MFARNRFWWWFGCVTALGAVHVLGVYLASPGPIGTSWVKNDPTMCAFVPALLPWIVAIAAAILVPDLRENFSPDVRRVFRTIFTALTAVAFLLIAIPDLRRGPLEPYALRSVAAAAKADYEEREKVRASHEKYEDEPPVTKDDVAKMNVTLRIASRTAVKEYMAAAKAQFTGLGDFIERGSFSAWTKFAINCVVAITIPFYFAFLLAIGYSLTIDQPGKFSLEALLIALSLLILWFPVRLYTEWYLHFFTLSYLTNFPAFFILLAVAILSLFWVVFIMKPGRAAVTIPALVSAFTTGFGVVSVFKPEVLWWLARVFERMAFEYAVALLAISIACTAVVVSGVMRRRAAAALAAESLNPS
jgi:hypothetical protein